MNAPSVPTPKPGWFKYSLREWLFPHSGQILADAQASIAENTKLQQENRELAERVDQEIDRRIEAESAIRAAASDWRIPEELLSEEDMAAALDVPSDNALWQALHQLLDVAIQEAVEESSQPPAGGKVTGEDRTFASGGVDFLREFQRTLIAQRAKSRVKASAAAAEEKE